MSERLRQIARERGDTGMDGAARGGSSQADGPLVLRYPRRLLHGDLARALLGLALTAGPLMMIEPLLAVGVVLGLCAAIFAVYLARTILRYRASWVLEEGHVRQHGFLPGTIDWDGLRAAKLRYYTTKRGREGAGWLVLTLKGRAGSDDTAEQKNRVTKISVESTIEGFDDLLARAARAVREGTVDVDETSVHNFAAAGRPLGRAGEDDAETDETEADETEGTGGPAAGREDRGP
ncbi:hypothetical protein KAJ83_13990 [Marivibrio halodurans]|uniref:PH domain-containing protein n=1 Tax=Marivibrio halodurans TaxID=2039722 RepID=A0A8J7SP57_9PROT|nr:hypothetical protein [Marivibrio halodurans]MBP5858126.1 hypothetical protein [Marivibrio halodurans]